VLLREVQRPDQPRHAAPRNPLPRLRGV
jgi:hypothetical protein